MTNKQQFTIKVTANRKPRKSKPTSAEEQIANFEQKLLDLIGDPTIQYLLVPKGNALTRSLVDALHEVRRGLCN